MVMLNASITAWIGHFLACMGKPDWINIYGWDLRHSGLGDVQKQPGNVDFTPALLWKHVGVNKIQTTECSGCFGCCAKPTPIIAVDEPSKGLKIQGRVVKKPSISDGFWSTSTCELDNSTVLSQRSISSLSVSNQNLSAGTGGSSSNSEFVNHGLLLWHQNRLQWVESSTPTNETQRRRDPRLGWNVSYEGLLGTRNPFPQRIPLSEMVDFLVEIWEQEGLYD